MAADTAQKRLSAIAIGMPWRGPAVLPDGTVDAGARAALVFLYSGIAGAAPVESGPAAIAGTVRARTTITGTVTARTRIIGTVT